MTMIDPDSIRSYYSQLTTEELIKLAKKEGHRFSEEAIEYLYDEIVRRGLDTAIVGSALETKDMNVAVAALDPAILNDAIQAKKAGKSDNELLQELTARQVSEAQAALIISRLPDYNYWNEQFDNLITLKSNIGSLRSLFTTFIRGSNNYWLELLKRNPENIVWIKPMKERRGESLIPFYREMRYQLLTKDGNHLTMHLNKEERQLFFEGVTHILPHAHIGYTHEIESFYNENPENLIPALLGSQLYTPIDTYETLADIENAPYYTIRHPHHH